MGASSDQLERQIVEIRGSMESKIIELRERSRTQVRRLSRTLVIAVGVGAAVGVAVVGALIVYRVTRPGQEPRWLASCACGMTGDPEEFRTAAGIPCGSLSGLTVRVQHRYIRFLYCRDDCLSRQASNQTDAWPQQASCQTAVPAAPKHAKPTQPEARRTVAFKPCFL